MTHAMTVLQPDLQVVFTGLNAKHPVLQHGGGNAQDVCSTAAAHRLNQSRVCGRLQEAFFDRIVTVYGSLAAHLEAPGGGGPTF